MRPVPLALFAALISASPLAAENTRPKLFGVTIGVGALAAHDAEDFAAILLRQKGPLYSDVSVKTLTQADASRAHMLAALAWLQEQVTPRDVGVLLIAGAGGGDDRQNLWFPAAAAPENRLLGDEIRVAISASKGKSVLFLDVCRADPSAGGEAQKACSIDMNRLVNDLTTGQSKVVVFAASQGHEIAQENPEWGHGAFGAALIEAVGEGKADFMGSRMIKLTNLDVYLAERVKQLTDGGQNPLMVRPVTVPDFALARGP